LDIPENAKVNLHLRVNGSYVILPLTAPIAETYRVLGNPSDMPPNISPDWRLLASEPLGPPQVGGEPRKAIRGEWRVNLLEELRRRLPSATAYRLEGMIIGNSSHAEYLMAGLSGNAAGTVYRVGRPQFEPH
jgi:hypothetical protein